MSNPDGPQDKRIDIGEQDQPRVLAPEEIPAGYEQRKSGLLIKRSDVVGGIAIHATEPPDPEAEKRARSRAQLLQHWRKTLGDEFVDELERTQSPPESESLFARQYIDQLLGEEVIKKLRDARQSNPEGKGLFARQYIDKMLQELDDE